MIRVDSSDIECRLQKLQRRLRRARVTALAAKQHQGQLHPATRRALHRRTMIRSSSAIMGKIVMITIRVHHKLHDLLAYRIHDNQAASNSASDSDNFSRGFAEEPPNVTLSLNETPQQSTDRLATTSVLTPIGTTCSTSSTSIPKPQHIWSQTTRIQRPWLAFSGEDGNTASCVPTINTPPNDFSSQQMFRSTDTTQMKEMDAYLLAYGSISNEDLG